MSEPDPEYLDRLIRQYSEGEKEAYDSAAALQDHTDQMLTWLLGLMGAGLIAGVPLLKNAPIGARFGAVAPWLVGILAALGGRTIAARLRNRESLWHFEKAVRIRKLLLAEPGKAVAELGRIINREDTELQRRHCWTKRNGAAMERWYYASLILFGVGMIALVAVLFVAVIWWVVRAGRRANA